MALKAAFVGAGNVARVHLTALRDGEPVSVVGLYDADRARAEERAAEFGVPRVYGSWAELLGDGEVEVVGVLLPHDLHRQFTVEALEAGKHVVCEKPLAATLEECDAMLEAAQRSGRRLFPVQNRLYHLAYEKLGQLAHEGAIGTIFLAQTNGFEGPQTVGVRPWLGSERKGGGVLMAQAVHPVYALRWLLGDVTRVTCAYGGRKVVPMVAEDTAVATLTFASGAVASMTATFGLAQGPFDHAIMLYGDAGYLEVRSGRRRGEGGPAETLKAISPTLFGDRALHEIELPPVTERAADFRRMWQDYAQAIAGGGEARVSDRDGRQAVEVVLAAHRAAETGTAVALPL
ncbi:MAG TPA: Gfo/Idh/MocA family oxidoreductase [Chloroflexota bacterium]|jgi:predicted dehydrogenase|nr:Gfo/Idh/MocA family oxidoreductase [Chloroflexota bacterium]